MKINECMCNNVFSVKPNCKVEEAVNLMRDNHIGCVAVCDDSNSIVGILTDRDILLRTVACNKDVKTTPISDVMTCNVCTCNPEDEVCEAENKMGKNQIRRIPVVDNNNKLVGMLTMGDIARFDNQLGKENVSTTISNICDCHGSVKNAE